ncbi:MAG TPA: CPBP family glutamic-type intramembrane protease, partial [Anaerolineaceae bacterium]
MSDFVSPEQSILVPSRILLVRHPLIAYFAIAFLGTWLVDLPIVLGQDGLGVMGYSLPHTLNLILFLISSFTGPTLGAVLVTGAVEGKPGLRAFFRRYIQWRINIRWYILVFLGVPLVYLISAVLWLGFAAFRIAATNWLALFTIYLPAVLIYPAAVTWGEEPGWSGFGLTQLQLRYRPVLASLIVGFFHGLWRLPVYLIVNGPVALGPFNLGRFLINTAAIMMITIVWAWVFNNAAGSILMAVLIHAAFNAAQIWIG